MKQNKTRKLTNKEIAQKGMFDEDTTAAGTEKKKVVTIPVKKADSIKRPWPDLRLLFLVAMGVFVTVIFGWGICQTIKSINMAGMITAYSATQGITKIVDNSQ